MIKAYIKYWTNIFNFKGRSTRSDYWYVVLANFIIGIIFGIIAGFVPTLEILSTIYSVVSFIPGLALIVRRYHDINKSGWNYLWVFVPLAGFIIVIIHLVTASVNENNKYGERA